jgi:hypothetical protein
MAKFSPTEAVFAGFRFARERPAAILVWSAFLLVVLAVVSIAMFDLGGDSMTSLVIASHGDHPDPKQLMKLMQEVAPATLFASLLMIVFGAVLSTAVLRVLLKPGPHAWAGLRLGGDELRMLGATVMVVLVVFGLELLLGTASGLLAGVGVPPIVSLIPGLVLILAVQVRLSLVGVISQVEHRIDLARSVRLTRKRFWPLLGAYVLLLAITLVILFLLTIVFAALMGAATLASGGGVNQLALMLSGKFSEMNPLLMVVYVASNLAQVWLAVVFLTVWLAIGVETYRAASKDPA